MSNTLAQKLKNKIPQKGEPRAPKAPEAKQVRLKLVYIDFMSALKLSFSKCCSASNSGTDTGTNSPCVINHPT